MIPQNSYHFSNEKLSINNLLNLLKNSRYHTYAYVSSGMNASIPEINKLIQTAIRSGLQIEIKKKITLNRAYSMD